MLQKLLIALCTIFVLSACGGDLDLGPSNPPPPDNDNGDDDDGGDGDDFEPSEPQRWLYLTFDEEGSADSWLHRCFEGCNATAEISLSTDQEVLSVTPEWASEEDALEVYTPIEEIGDVVGANASVWVYVPEAYFNDGHLEMALFLENASGGTAYTRNYAPSQAGWNQVAIYEMQPGTGEAATDGDGEEFIDYGSFAWHSSNFVLTDVNAVGVQFIANGKPVDVNGELWLDNLLLTPSSGFAPMLLSVTEDWLSKGNYLVEGNEAADPVYGDGFVSLTVDQPNQQLVQAVPGEGGYVGAEIIFTLSFDEAYLNSASGYQPFGQVYDDTDPDGFADDDEVGGEWGCWTGLGEVTADEEFEVTCVMNDDIFDISSDQYVLFGVQSQGDNAAGTMRIHRVEIAGAAEPASELILPTDDGWRVNSDVLTLTYTDDGVAFTASPAEYQQLLYDLSGPQDLSGARYEVVFSVDETFKASSKNVQPFVQRTDDYGIADYSCFVGNGSLTAGEDYTASCNALSDDFNLEDEEAGLQIGIQTQGDSGTDEGTVTIKSLTIFLR